MSGSAVYLDSSALVKLVISEPESSGLAEWFDDSMRLTTCALARTEVLRAVVGGGEVARVRARALIARIDVISVDDALLDAAALLEPSSLRTLDALHLAAAMSLGEDLRVVVAYDRRLLAAAASVGISVVSPGTEAGPTRQ